MVHGKNSTMESAVLALAERQPLLRARDLTAQALPTVVLVSLNQTSAVESERR